jgi:large repetitive protein
MRRPFTRRRLGRLAAMAALGGLALTGLSTTGATFTSTQDAGAASFTTRVACSAGTSYPATVTGLNPTVYYRFGEAGSPYPGTVADSSGSGNTGSVVAGSPASSSEAFGAASPIWCDSTAAIQQPAVDRSSTTAGFVVWPSLRTHPDVFTLMAWIQVPAGMATGGAIIGLGDSAVGQSTNHDRQLLLDNAGHVVFGIFPGSAKTITSAGTVNDGRPHEVAASLGPAGGRLYVDGALVAADATWTTAQAFDGYWRVGWDSAAGWISGTDPTNFGMDGVIDEAAVFEGSELSQAQVSATYAANHW